MEKLLDGVTANTTRSLKLRAPLSDVQASTDATVGVT